ncbi:carbon-nitrogen hydrolase family protein [Cohnella silvisoli]|uniref:Nitrilase-related carbon-nitrogen hydrolase n=1 Tax=Cohnella silvisoli TaxID=2873699 RepID=A0ABV1L2I5_9BACL|nr:nitrilase-related carbon-nitrogen hydrolase [Cohnella silvisoli]
MTISTFNFHYGVVESEADVEASIQQIERYLTQRIGQVLPDQPDLIVLPECCDMPSGLAEDALQNYYRARGERIRDALSLIAKQNSCYIAYPSIRLDSDDKWWNSVQLLDRNGDVAGVYNKNHPVIIEIDENQIQCGKETPVIECDFGRVAFAICFDLNFDELRLKYVRENPDLILFPSMFHGGFMQQYWAYSCRAHFVGAIAGGLPSSIVSPVGQVVSSTSSYYDFVSATINLDCAVVHLDYNRGKLEAIRQKYGKKVRVTDPGYVGSVLLSSETEEFSTEDLVREFEIEKLDDYMARSRLHQQ